MKDTLEPNHLRLRHYTETTPVWLRRFTKFVAASTLFLIFAGAMVTSTGSGLAVPDWPTTYGENMFTFPLSKWVGGIFYEHGHRLIASMVGFLTIIQALWLQRREPKRYVRVLGWIALAAVIVQGLLGGLTVIFLLPTAISVAHAGLAEIFFCLNVSIAFFTSRFFHQLRAMPRGDTPVTGTTALLGITYAQILVGALMRHLGAGLAIPDFPLAFGRIIPEFASTGIIVNYAHRVGAATVTVAILILAARLLRFERNHPLRLLATLLLLVIPAQILLGGYTVWSGKQPVITSLHVVVGASTLALTLVLMLSARTIAWRSEKENAGRTITLATPEATA
ncbi:MAG TPA: COX15/CtaA family protein [Thermoanaerobaculia bacterium]